MAQQAISTVSDSGPSSLGEKGGPSGSIALPDLGFVVLQLGLALLAIRLFTVEDASGYATLAPLIFTGFIVHALSPRRVRPALFLLLSLASIILVLGLRQGPALIAMGVGLLAICHLPIAFWGRVLLLVAVGVGMAVFRAELVEPVAIRWGALSTTVLPLLASMFMFRLIIYMYDLRNEREPRSIWERLSYFFMLPNVCFPLYPVVDYQAFRRSYYAKPEGQIYQKGLNWMVRGITHILAYRLVYYFLLPAATEVADLPTVAVWVVTTYLLYLRISGQFHLIVGTLCLFGFDLPETHRLYFLASSFNDFWRRINIYWKDFMMKVFYYPAFSRLRGRSTTTRITVATIFVFVCTWILHSYQWFWLRGSFPILPKDLIFWGILGVFVIVNSLWEFHSRSPAKATGGWSPVEALRKSARTVGMFVFISFLWSLWSTTTVREWWRLVAASRDASVGTWVWGATLLGVAVLAGVLFQWAGHTWKQRRGAKPPSAVPARAYVLVTSLALIALSQPGIQTRVGGSASMNIAALGLEQLNQADRDLIERGYYEDLLDAPIYTQAAAARRSVPRDWERARLVFRATNDFQLREIVPSVNVVHKRVPFGANRWGMRDRDYPLDKPEGTIRFALLGASYEVGGGVEVSKTWEAVLENRLNTDLPAPHDFEILNFAVDAHSVTQNVVEAERAMRFDPDVLLLTAYRTEIDRARAHFANAVPYEVPDPDFRRLFEESGVEAAMSYDERVRHLGPYLDEMLRLAYEKIAEECRRRGVIPVLVNIPSTAENVEMDRAGREKVLGFAAEAGFLILDLDGAYEDWSRREIRVAPWDPHPSELGHELIADKLYEVLQSEDLLDTIFNPVE